MLRHRDAAGHVVACSTHIGRTHEKNQDSGGAWTEIRADGTAASLVVVADGVSAGRNSERASRLASDLIQARLIDALRDGDQDGDALLALLKAAGEEASRQIATQAREMTASSDATTLAAAICLGRRVVGIWCGDSRIYQISGKSVTRLTQDHSWAEGVVSHGLMTVEQAARDPRAHMITRWLGPQEEESPGIETIDVTAEKGDVVLCCTDGLYGYLTPPDGREEDLITMLAPDAGSLQERLDRAVQIALSRGGHDDITGAAVEIAT